MAKCVVLVRSMLNHILWVPVQCQHTYHFLMPLGHRVLFYMYMLLQSLERTKVVYGHQCCHSQCAAHYHCTMVIKPLWRLGVCAVMDAGWIMPQWPWCSHSAFLHIFSFSVTAISDPRAVHKSPWQHGQRAGLVLQSIHQEVLVGVAACHKQHHRIGQYCWFQVFACQFFLFPPIPEHDHYKIWCIGSCVWCLWRAFKLNVLKNFSAVRILFSL